jgi:hypothetical protein
MRSLFTFLFALLLTNLSAGKLENESGMGVVSGNIQERFTLSVWNDPQKDKVPLFEISFRYDTVKGMIETISDSNKDSLSNWFQPEYFNTEIEKARLDMHCLERNGDWCKVIIHQQEHKTAWVQLNKDLIFLDWLLFYQGMATIEPIRDTSGIIGFYDRPDLQSPFHIAYQYKRAEDSYNVLMRPIEIQGNWMKVEISVRDPKPLSTYTYTYTGWILWRDGDKPLVQYNVMGC